MAPFAYSDNTCVFCREGLDPGRVFNRTTGVEEVPEGYRAMDRREALKVLVRP